MNTIELHNVTYSDKHSLLLHPLDLVVAQGKMIQIIGDKTAGKTTLLQLLSGIISPSSGNGTLLETDIYKLRENGCYLQIGYVPYELGLCDELSVFDQMTLFAELYQISRDKQQASLTETLKILNLEKIANSLIAKLTTKQKLFLGIGLAIMHRPKLLLIDDPSVYLKPADRWEFMQLLKTITDRAVTIILTTQNLVDGLYCDELFLMQDGRILISGSIDALLHTFPGTCLQASTDLVNKWTLEEITPYSIASYLAGRYIRVIARPGYKTILENYGFRVAQPTLEDIKLYYENRGWG